MVYRTELANPVVGVLGDVHGNLGVMLKVLPRFAQLGVTNILQLGDFGLWPDASGRKFKYRVNKKLEELGQTLFVTLGNHEDYPQVEKFVPHPTYTGFVYDPTQPHVLYATRGARWVWNNTSFVSLGGANSIDFKYRTENKNWWKGEQITDQDVENTVKGGYADVMVTHDCPIGVDLFGEGRKTLSAGWSDEEVNYSNQSRVQLRKAVNQVKPDLLMHGHYHAKYVIQTSLTDYSGTRYVLKTYGFACDGEPDSLGLLNVDTKQVEYVQ